MYLSELAYGGLDRRRTLNRSRLLQRTLAPAVEPLTLTEAKLYLRVDNTDEDTLITDLIVAARMIAENWLRKSLISQSWKLAYDYVLPQPVPLLMGPVNDVSSIIAYFHDNTSQTIDSTAYHLNAAQNALVFCSPLPLVLGQRIEISYDTGYGADESAIPRPIKQGLLSHIAALYDSRGENGTSDLPEQAVALYMPYRELRL